MSEALVVHLDSEGVLTLTMDRPEVHNAFDEEQIIRLTDVLTEAKTNEDVKLLVLDSEGTHFCAGADFKYMERMGTNSREQNAKNAEDLATLMKTLNEFPKPTIARVQGAAYGAAVGLVCCCDIAIGGKSSVFSLNEVKVGLVPATVAPYVIRAVGHRTARRLFISGERVAALAAQNMGFLHSVVNDEILDDAVEGVVDALLENSSHAMEVAKEVSLKLASAELSDEISAYLVETVAEIVDSEEGREGTAALIEKRCAKWVHQLKPILVSLKAGAPVVAAAS